MAGSSGKDAIIDKKNHEFGDRENQMLLAETLSDAPPAVHKIRV